MCDVFRAWGHLIAAADAVDLDPTLEPYVYDVVNVGREVLAQLTLPLSLDFNNSLYDGSMPSEITARALARHGAHPRYWR